VAQAISLLKTAIEHKGYERAAKQYLVNLCKNLNIKDNKVNFLKLITIEEILQ